MLYLSKQTPKYLSFILIMLAGIWIYLLATNVIEKNFILTGILVIILIVVLILIINSKPKKKVITAKV